MGVQRPGDMGYTAVPDGQIGLCGFKSSPASLACLMPAKWHGVYVDFNEDDYDSMFACEKHKEVLNVFSEYVHELDAPCGLPGSLFKEPENFCYIPDDGLDAFMAQAAMEVLV